jgi:hypothetical protein
MTTQQIIKELIEGNTVTVLPEQRDEVQRELRKIKKNCTIILSQMKEF